MIRAFAVLVSATLVLPALGHEDLHVRISDLDQRISSAPDADLYARRADLHRRHRDWAKAIRDYQAADELEPGMSNVRIGRAQVYLDKGDPAAALLVLTPPGDEVAERSPAGRLLEARALALMGKTQQANVAFATAIGELKRPMPEHYLEHSRALAAAEPTRTREAITVLERGCEKLGALISLQSEAYQLERGAGELAAALLRVRRIISGPGSSIPRWRLAEGELLGKLGCPEEARAAYGRVLAEIESRSPRRRSTPAAIAAAGKARTAMAALDHPAVDAGVGQPKGDSRAED